MGFLHSVCVWEKKRFKENSCCLGGFTYIAVPDARNKESINFLFSFTENKRKGTDKFQKQLRTTTTTHASRPHEWDPWMSLWPLFIPSNFTIQKYHVVRAQTPKTKTSSLVDKKWHTRVSSTQTESFQNKLIINGWQERLLASSGNFLALTCTKTRPKREKPEMVMQQQPKLGSINNNNTTQSTKTNNT